MNFPTSLRDRRHFFGPTHYSIAHYCTETPHEMKPTFADEYFLDNLHQKEYNTLHNLIPEQLKKNLADTIITEEKMQPKNEFNKIDVKTNENNPNRTENSPLTGITNFLSGVLNVISGAMFSRRKVSTDTDGEMALECAWHGAKSGDENKILQDEHCPNVVSEGITVAEMGECRAAAAHCQNKLDQVRLLLSKPVPCTVRVKRRPRKVFVEPGSVEDSFEDAFAPEDFENLSSNSYLEYVSPYCYHDNDYHEVSAPKIRTEKAPLFDNVDIVRNVPETVTTIDKIPESVVNETGQIFESIDIVKNVPETVTTNKTIPESVGNDKKEELIASCEDKLSKLKALLQDRKKKIIEPEPVLQMVKETPKQKPVTKIKDKHYKNSNRCTDKRRKSKMRQNINNDMLFANDINTDDLSSAENSPLTRNNVYNNVNNNVFIPKTSSMEYFDEVSGRFHSTSATDSEDSFQIVFNDSPRLRRPSDCESEDSFIIFDDSQDSCYASNTCYTTNDVFGDSSDSDSCDSDSELSDSGCGNLTFKLSHSLSKSVGNLTDDSLYNNASEDEVDCSKVELTVCGKVTGDEINSGLLIDSRRREIRRSLPPKKVQFSTQPPKVHVMRVWAFAAKQARAGHWERYALDRERFKRRIADVEVAVSWVLRPQHRSRVMFQRFMPWWNAQKRRELAEKKHKEEEEKKEQERQQVRQEQIAADETSEQKLKNEDINDEAIVFDSPVQGFTPIEDSSLKPSLIVTLPKELCDNLGHRTPDVGTPSLSNVLKRKGSNDDNEEFGNLADILTSKDDNFSNSNCNVEEVLKDHNLIKLVSSEVNIPTQGNGEDELLKRNTIQQVNTSNNTKLQSGEHDNQLDDHRSNIGEFIVQNGEFNSQDSRGVIQEPSNKNHKQNDDKYFDNNAKMNREDSKTMKESKKDLLNDFLVNIKHSNDRTESRKGTNDTKTNEIVLYNDKMFNNDYLTDWNT